MSVLINMEMPEKQTTLTIFPNGYVAIYDAKDSFIGEAKAVPVPPHGDLVERQAVLNTFSIHMNRTLHFVTIRDTVPTIIPAEEGE